MLLEGGEVMSTRFLVIALRVIGVVLLVSAVVVGVLTGSIRGLVISVLGSISTVVVYFALAAILENQEYVLGYISGELGRLEKRLKSYIRTGDKVCERCNSSYDPSYSYCPNCGYRNVPPSAS